MKRMYVGAYNRTCQRAVAQAELCNVVAKLADVRRKCEARFVARQTHLHHALCLRSNNRKRQFSCGCGRMVHMNDQQSTRHVARNIQLALENILLEPELSQVHEVAELLGQFTCTKKWNVSETHKRMYDGTYNSPWNKLSARMSLIKLTRLASSLGNSPAKK